MKLNTILAVGALSCLVAAQSIQSINYQNLTGVNVRRDSGLTGPAVEEVHYYCDQWPIGLAVSKQGRIFVCYTRGTYAYTLGEVSNTTAEVPYPNLAMNTPPGGLSTSLNGIPFGSNSTDTFISVQALFVTPDDTLWVLDTGRPSTNETEMLTMPYASPGGPKLVAINLTNNSIIRTYTFPSSVHFPDSYMNDLRFDMRANATASGKGIAYINDSSNEDRTGFIMLDLGTGQSWRQLTQHPSTLRTFEDVPSYQGVPFYQRSPGLPLTNIQEGLDGIELSLYGDVMYYSPLTSDYLYSIETQYLRVNPKDDVLSSQRASNNVMNLGQRGGNANGFSADSNGAVYMLMPEQNAIYIYNSTTLQAEPYIRDPRIIWPDSSNVGFDGYIYFNINQLPYQPDWNNGTDLRQYPGVILRSKLPNNGTKSTVLAA